MLDPNQDAPAWEYTFVADVGGEPHVIDGMLVAADVAGRFLAFDPASRRPLGAGLTLKAIVAPTATRSPSARTRLLCR
ncbi:MAG: hypothetical protein EXR98_11345 [Gemmataceae bacterium]|nr:hypothetical protein [Gemmataceae bacterium]